MTTDLDPALYLAPCGVIDFDVVEVAQLAKKLAADNPSATAERCFLFVRDTIEHSSDHKRNPITCKASEVLEHGTGYCYAKSHLLCALLRANGIPAGLSYQRLSIDGLGPPYCLHGLVSVYLPPSECKAGNWYRVDPRGNRDDPAGINRVDAQFDPPNEQLAFALELPGEYDLPDIYQKPLPAVVAALQTFSTWDSLLANLPDDPES